MSLKLCVEENSIITFQLGHRDPSPSYSYQHMQSIWCELKGEERAFVNEDAFEAKGYLIHFWESSWNANNCYCIIFNVTFFSWNSFMLKNTLQFWVKAKRSDKPIKMRVFHQNEGCLLALSFLHNSKEDGGKKGSSHFDETLSLW